MHMLRIFALLVAVAGFVQAGCEGIPQQQGPVYSASYPHPNPQTELQLATRQYQQALEFRRTSRNQRQIQDFNKQFGTYDGSGWGAGISAGQDMLGIVGNNEADLQLQSAQLRLENARRRVGNTVNVNHTVRQ